MAYSIGIMIYPQVEVLDFCGPFEVFRNAKLFNKEEEIEVFTVARDDSIVDAQGLFVKPSYSFATCPQLDLLVIPGGNGSWLKDQVDHIQFLQSQFAKLQNLLTVCTGALLLATADLYPDNMAITTHQSSIDLLQELAPSTNVRPEVRFTAEDRIVTSGGISAGIDSSLYLVEKLWGTKLAQKIAKYMEYDWRIRQPGQLDPVVN